MTTLVFVYGSLLRGESNHHFLAGARFVERTSTGPAFSMYDFGWFPAVVAGGVTAISGEIYEVNETTLASLDRLEGHPRMYRRTPIAIGARRVETYLMTPEQVEGRRRIASGSWQEGQTR